MSAAAIAAPGIRQVGQILVNAHDLDRAVRFYRDVLGLQFLFQAPPGMAFFRCGELSLLVGLPEKAEFDHPASVLYFDVADIAAAHEALTARGVTFRTAPHAVHREPGRELWLADFHDSEGNTMALMSWKGVKREA